MSEKKLVRKAQGQMLGGVAYGIADYTNSDPILWRALFIITFLVGGGGLLVYIILWIVLPLETISDNKYKTTMEDQHVNYDKKEKNDSKKNKNDGNLWGGIILIVLGSIFLVDRFVPRVDFGDLWPLILIAIGAILLIKSVPPRNQP